MLEIVEHFRCGKVVVKVRLLRQVANIPVHFDVAYGFAEDPRASRRRKNQAHQQLDSGGLARPVRTNEPEDFALFHFHIQSLERGSFLQVQKSVRVYLG